MQLGSYIKSRRLNIGLTHKQLAEKMDTTVTTISKWENNHVEPSLSNFIKLCEVLGMNPLDFIPLTQPDSNQIIVPKITFNKVMDYQGKEVE